MCRHSHVLKQPFPVLLHHLGIEVSVGGNLLILIVRIEALEIQMAGIATYSPVGN